MNKFFILIFALVMSFLPSLASTEGLGYDFSGTKSFPINLKIVNEISTKENIYEGQELEFVVLNTVKDADRTIVSKNQIVKARVETIITAGMNGFPAEIIIDGFEIPGVKESQLLSTYTKYGQNRCYFVYPIKWALTPIPFVGSLTNFIMGGHAKIRKKDIITIYYYPNWSV